MQPKGAASRREPALSGRGDSEQGQGTGSWTGEQGVCLVREGGFFALRDGTCNKPSQGDSKVICKRAGRGGPGRRKKGGAFREGEGNFEDEIRERRRLNRMRWARDRMAYSLYSQEVENYFTKSHQERRGGETLAYAESPLWGGGV